MSRGLLARDGLDFGLPTDNGDQMEAFYGTQLGLPLLQRDTISEGYYEVFYEMHRSWLKLNPSDVPMAPAVSGYSELLIADSGLAEPKSLTDPDGLTVTLVPTGHRGIDEVGRVIRSVDPDAQRRFITDGMGGVAVGEGHLVGNTMMFVEQIDQPLDITPIVCRGFTMLTLVVSDLPSAHARLIEAGGSHGLRMSTDPAHPGRCLFSFVRDPGGNWIELCQFADLSGPLPTLSEPDPSFEEFVAFRDHGTPA
ncbi:hypothetical protein BH10ACT3_BH10ACT3_00730 [soil metagenome]